MTLFHEMAAPSAGVNARAPEPATGYAPCASQYASASASIEASRV